MPLYLAIPWVQMRPTVLPKVKVMATRGQPAQLREPLDFLVLADHTDALGAMVALKRQ